MATDTLQLSQPTAFLEHPGAPTVPWNRWLVMFKNYLTASGLENPSDARKKAILMHCLGCEGQRILSSLTTTLDTDSFDQTVTHLEGHFGDKINIVAERHRFRQRAQRSDEKFGDYVAALRELAAKCNFVNPAVSDEMIRDQIVEKVHMHKIRERLLMETDLTLTKTIQLASQIESAISNA